METVMAQNLSLTGILTRIEKQFINLEIHITFCQFSDWLSTAPCSLIIFTSAVICWHENHAWMVEGMLTEVAWLVTIDLVTSVKDCVL